MIVRQNGKDTSNQMLLGMVEVTIESRLKNCPVYAIAQLTWSDKAVCFPKQKAKQNKTS